MTNRTVLVIRVPQWRLMPEKTTYNTATLVMMVGGAFVVLDPFLVALGAYIQSHSSIVFSPGYSDQLKHWVEVALTAYVAHKHTQQP